MDLNKILPKNGPPINEVTKYIEKYSQRAIKKKRNLLNKNNIGAFGSVFDIKQFKIKFSNYIYIFPIMRGYVTF